MSKLTQDFKWFNCFTWERKDRMWWCNRLRYRWKCWWHHHKRNCMIWGTQTWISQSTPTAYTSTVSCTRRCSSTPGCRTPRRRSYTPHHPQPSIHSGTGDSGRWRTRWTCKHPICSCLRPSLADCSHLRDWRRNSLDYQSREWTQRVSPAGKLQRRCTLPDRTHSLRWRMYRGPTHQNYSRFCPRSDLTSPSELGSHVNYPWVTQTL